MKVVSLNKTCSFCPLQWEGRLSDGRYTYIRYRWGWLGVAVGDTEDEAVGNKYIYHEKVGDDYDGFMDTKVMMRYVPLKFSLWLKMKAWLPKVKVTWSEY